MPTILELREMLDNIAARVSAVAIALEQTSSKDEGPLLENVQAGFSKIHAQLDAIEHSLRDAARK